MVVKGATEEERLGLVKGDTVDGRLPALPSYEDEEEDEWPSAVGEKRRELTPPRHSPEREREKDLDGETRSSEEEYYEVQKRKWGESGKKRDRDPSPGAGKGAFI